MAQIAIISTLTPSSTASSKALDLRVRGVNTHFQQGVTALSFVSSSNKSYSPRLFISNTVTATITIPAGLPPDHYNITLATRNEYVTAGFDVFSTPVGALNADIQVLPMEAISLKNIDLTNPRATPVLFLTNIYNNDTPRTVNISITVTSGSKGLLGTISRKGVYISASATVNFTNRDYDAIKTNGAVPGTPGYDFLNSVELTGVFPPDNYTYVITVTDVNTRQSVTASSTTTLTNNFTNPSLITPGAGFVDHPPAEYNPLPLFQWFGQNDRYDFAIYETRPGQTPEEATRNVPVYRQLDVSGNSLLYPNSAEKLIDGRTYAWQVQGKVPTANGIRYLPSEVYRFIHTNAIKQGIRLVSSVKVTPEEVTLAAGAQFKFTAICYDENNIVIPDAKPVWSVSPGVGSITQDGVYTAGAGGNTVAVLVTAGTATEFSTVTISLDIFSAYKSPYTGFVKKLFGLQ